MRVVSKTESTDHIFSAISKEEVGPISTFLQGKNVRLKNDMDETMEVDAISDLDDLEDDEEMASASDDGKKKRSGKEKKSKAAAADDDDDDESGMSVYSTDTIVFHGSGVQLARATLTLRRGRRLPFSLIRWWITFRI